MVANRDLANKDATSLSDPVCVVYECSRPSISRQKVEYVELGRTEIIHNNLNPTFRTNIDMYLRGDEDRLLEFRLYDVDCCSSAVIKNLRIYIVILKNLTRWVFQGSAVLTPDNFLGSYEISSRSIWARKVNACNLSGKSQGVIVIQRQIIKVNHSFLISCHNTHS
jgi:hypothetical protein